MDSVRWDAEILVARLVIRTYLDWTNDRGNRPTMVPSYWAEVFGVVVRLEWKDDRDGYHRHFEPRFVAHLSWLSFTYSGVAGVVFWSLISS